MRLGNQVKIQAYGPGTCDKVALRRMCGHYVDETVQADCNFSVHTSYER